MGDDPGSVLHRYCEGFERIRQHMEKELRAFIEADNERRFTIAAQQLMDRIWGNLDYLCNLESVTYNSGERGDPSDVIEKIKDHMSESYTSIFGEEYMPRTCRQAFGEQRRVFHGPERDPDSKRARKAGG